MITAISNKNWLAEICMDHGKRQLRLLNPPSKKNQLSMFSFVIVFEDECQAKLLDDLSSTPSRPAWLDCV